jgi:hypothetical protein
VGPGGQTRRSQGRPLALTHHWRAHDAARTRERARDAISRQPANGARPKARTGGSGARRRGSARRAVAGDGGTRQGATAREEGGG